MRTRPLLLAAILILTTLAPLSSAGVEPIIDDEKTSEQVVDFDLPIRYIDDIQPRTLTSETSGRAPCSTIQSDGGTAGDAGNTSTTSKDLGSNPNSGSTGGLTGCVDTNDPEDLFKVTTTAGKDVDIELVVPASADFDLYIVDSAITYAYDRSEYNDPLEKVTTAGTNLSGQAATFYIYVTAYSGDGQYTLRVWTNNTVPRPDMTITAISHPPKALAGDTINVNYTVANLANNSSANTGAFDVFFILSTDTTYDQFDTILDDVSKETDIAASSNRTTTMSITLPANLTNDSYYWIVWADGYGNVTESNSTNNDMTSMSQMVVGKDCFDLVGGVQNDANLGVDAANEQSNATNMGSNVTATYTGCMDGADGDDIFAFDVPAGHYIEVSMTAEDNSSDLDLFLHNSTNVEVDRGYTSSYPETATAKLTAWEGVGDTYYVNVSHYSGVSNYTLDVWTNYSIPAPDLLIESVTGPSSGMPGDAVTVAAMVNNNGTEDANSSFIVRAYLTAYLDVNWFDYQIGETTVSSMAINTPQTVLIQSVLPTGLVEGEYYLFVVVDEDEMIEERDEDNNMLRKNTAFGVGNEETACNNQDDASTGADAGDSAGNEADLGQYSQTEYRGCIDGNDLSDHYTISLAAGEILNVTLVDAPAGEANLDLLYSDGTQVDSSFDWIGNEANYVSTWDSDYNSTAGTYTLIVNRSSTWLNDGGAGTYRLLIGEPSEWVAPFTCNGHSDPSSSSDAGTNLLNPSDLGTDPDLEGQGCLDDQDISDAYRFSLSEFNNVEISFMQDDETPVITTLYDVDGNMILDWDGMMWNSMNTTYEGMNGQFTLVVLSLQSTGYYNLSITTTEPAPADLEVMDVMCPSDAISAAEVAYSFSVINNRGPTDITFEWHFELLDPAGNVLPLTDSNSLSTYATYGQTVVNKSGNFFLEETLPSGDYSCRVTIDVTDMIAESDEDNNMMEGETFYVQNEAELWANDVDRDGYNTTDSGDGIVDDCPDTWGESWGDRYGCADLDGDGWSNLNDFDPLNENQWLDEDEDGFGDNSSAYGGDQCPGVYGVENGEGGDGCPPAFVDTDGDGIEDMEDDCQNTPDGIIVDETGCEEIIDDNSGDGNSDGTGDGDNLGDDDNNDNLNDDDDTNDETSVTDSTESGGMDIMTIGGISGAVIVVILLTLLMVRRGGKDGLADEAFTNAAFADPMAGMAAGDSSITAEQLAYEQQLMAAGYPADYARQYADQHFRPWLNQ